MKKTETEQTILSLKCLIARKQKLYKRIKKKLMPLILKSIRDEEKVNGHKNYRKLYEEFETAVGLTRIDYEEIIYDLSMEEGIIENLWSERLGGFLKTVKT